MALPLNFTIREIEPHEIVDFTKQVFNSYQETFTKRHGLPMREMEFLDMIQEDQDFYVHSKYIVAEIEGEIVATSKITFWNETITLPIERDFGFNIPDFLIKNPNIETVFHWGRMAIMRETLTGKGLTKAQHFEFFKWFKFKIFEFVAVPNSITLNECDETYIKITSKLLGLIFHPVTDSQTYLGSTTKGCYTRGENFIELIAKRRLRMMPLL